MYQPFVGIFSFILRLTKNEKNDLTLESSFSAVRASWELPFKYAVEGDVYFNPCIGFVFIRTINIPLTAL